ncbi:MAG TPA: response regulator transcription factor [Actinomycetota bacterium]|nr:response regulator transcription factor [Actinomycetota bacterium]
MSIRTLIVDDHPVTRDGLRSALELNDEVTIVGEAASGEEAVERVAETQPDIVFMDVRMPGMGGIEATRKIREATPSTRVILFTVDESRSSISDAIQAGVSGYLLKDSSADELVDAARKAMEGKAVIHPQLTRAFIEEVQLTDDRPDAKPLSRREKEILQKVAFGATTREVAMDLGISPHTVKTHLERIFEKLGANDRAQAVAIAIRSGLVE